MKQLFFLLAIGLLACEQTPTNSQKVQENRETMELKTSDLPAIGTKIQGDFDGDGQIDIAEAVRIKEGKGNPLEDGTPDEYEIQFPGGKLKSISAGCCSLMLINEGDLDNNGTDELSVFQSPVNSCTYTMTTYGIVNGTWKQIVESFLIATGCDYLSPDDLQKRIFSENGVIYMYDIDPNDEDRKLFKKKVVND